MDFEEAAQIDGDSPPKSVLPHMGFFSLDTSLDDMMPRFLFQSGPEVPHAMKFFVACIGYPWF